MSHRLLLGAVLALAAAGFCGAQEPAKAAPAAGFTVARMVVCTGLENREPVGEASSFPATTEKVYCYLEARDVTADAQVTFVWSRDGQELNRTVLPLRQGARWRTHAVKTLYGKTGEWQVTLLDAAGHTANKVAFKVE